MNRHRGARVGLFVRRRAYMELLRRYRALEAEYRALEQDHQGVLEDHEGLLYDLETASGAGVRHIPSWAETEPLPAVRGLDPDKATALVHRRGLLTDPAGEWRSSSPGTSG